MSPDETKEPKPTPLTCEPRPSAGKAIGRFLLAAVIAAAIGGGTIFGLKKLESRVKVQRAPAVPIKMVVILLDKPLWMPLSLAKDLEKRFLPPAVAFEDDNLVAQVYERVRKDPWVREVRSVRKKQDPADARVGRVEVQAEYRLPAAMVEKDGQLYFVDGEGVAVPGGRAPRFVVLAGEAGAKCFADLNEIPPGVRVAVIHYIKIRGVAQGVPGPGERWKGQDLADGLRLVGLLTTRAYANQVAAVDVRNFGGRINKSEPYLRIVAEADGKQTDIRFGRFPVAEGDYEISPERKLIYLDGYFADHNGKIAGLNAYIDLRHDQLIHSIN